MTAEVVQSESGLSVLRVSSAAATGELYLQGAHISAWRPADEADVIWMSEASAFAPAEPIRGGVPICFPWFGPGRDSQSKPVHGVARLATWSLAEAEDVDGSVRVRLVLTDTELAGLPGAERWQHPFELTYSVSFGSELAIELTARNTGLEEFSFEEALHTYFCVDDINRVQVEGLDGAEYLDRAPGAAAERQTQSGPVTFTSETDRVYFSTSTATVIDEAAGRKITVAKENSASTVVWNPWVAKSAAMPDFGDEEWREMVCVETANALDDAIVLQPGETHTMSARFSVDRSR